MAKSNSTPPKDSQVVENYFKNFYEDKQMCIELSKWYKSYSLSDTAYDY